MTSVAFAAVVTTIVEPPIVAVFYRRRRVLRALLVAAAATLATNLWMNAVLPHWVSSETAFLFVGEGAAFVVEAIVYSLALRPLDVPRAVAASAFANGASFAIGLVLPR